MYQSFLIYGIKQSSFLWGNASCGHHIDALQLNRVLQYAQYMWLKECRSFINWFKKNGSSGSPSSGDKVHLHAFEGWHWSMNEQFVRYRRQMISIHALAFALIWLSKMRPLTIPDLARAWTCRNRMIFIYVNIRMFGQWLLPLFNVSKLSLIKNGIDIKNAPHCSSVKQYVNHLYTMDTVDLCQQPA